MTPRPHHLRQAVPLIVGVLTVAGCTTPPPRPPADDSPLRRQERDLEESGLFEPVYCELQKAPQPGIQESLSRNGVRSHGSPLPPDIHTGSRLTSKGTKWGSGLAARAGVRSLSRSRSVETDAQGEGSFRTRTTTTDAALWAPSTFTQPWLHASNVQELMLEALAEFRSGVDDGGTRLPRVPSSGETTTPRRQQPSFESGN